MSETNDSEILTKNKLIVLIEDYVTARLTNRPGVIAPTGIALNTALDGLFPNEKIQPKETP